MKVFNKLAAYYDLMFRENYAREVSVLAGVLKRLGVESGHLLDVGCGTGNHLLEFRKLGFSVEGVDSSKEMLRLARNRLGPVVKLHKARMEWLRLGESFDVVTLLSRTLLFVRNYFWLSVILKRLFNHLVPGGVLLMDLGIHEGNFSPDLSHSSYFHEKSVEGSLVEDYDLRHGKILWSANLSINDRGRLIRTVDDQAYLLINVHRLIELMKRAGFHVHVYGLEGNETTYYRQGLILAGVKRKKV